MATPEAAAAAAKEALERISRKNLPLPLPPPLFSIDQHGIRIFATRGPNKQLQSLVVAIVRTHNCCRRDILLQEQSKNILPL